MNLRAARTRPLAACRVVERLQVSFSVALFGEPPRLVLFPQAFAEAGLGGLDEAGQRDLPSLSRSSPEVLEILPRVAYGD